MSTLGEKIWKLFPGCPGNPDVIQLAFLLGRIAQDLQAGRISERFVEGFFRKHCAGLGQLFVMCKSSISPDKCPEVLADIVVSEAYSRGLMRMYEAYLKRYAEQGSSGESTTQTSKIL